MNGQKGHPESDPNPSSYLFVLSCTYTCGDVNHCNHFHFCHLSFLWTIVLLPRCCHHTQFCLPPPKEYPMSVFNPLFSPLLIGYYRLPLTIRFRPVYWSFRSTGLWIPFFLEKKPRDFCFVLSQFAVGSISITLSPLPKKISFFASLFLFWSSCSCRLISSACVLEKKKCIIRFSLSQL